MMNWIIPNFDGYVTYFIQEVSRWAGENILTLLIIGNVLQWLSNMAIKSKNVVDDKIISLLIYFFSFKWIKDLTTKKETP